jgi:hypothetical protein
MANHVHFSVMFHQINDEAKNKLNELYERIRQNGEAWFGDMFVDGKELTYEESEKYSWTNENIGPKWCYFEDWDEDGFNGYSAWSPPNVGVQNLLQILEDYDPNIITSICYEDEGPNFIGADVFWGADLCDGVEYQWEEIIPMVIAGSDTLTHDDWDEDEDDWKTDESREIFYEELYDVVNDRQWEFVEEEVENVRENIKESEDA